MADLQTDIRYIKGIGETRAKALNKLGINTLRDLKSFSINPSSPKVNIDFFLYE